ncbi:MAG: rhodanese-like domain-containing protein [Verrucomicrobia bacterium]|jgi:phage shock protein E|nr:rhodanese-like domain-containing protein [Verrucomicrobiota bacterium]
MRELLIPLLVVLAIAVWIFLRQGSMLPAEQARDFVRAGAVVVDVRTVEEFAAEHLPAAVNLPLSSLESRITDEVPDKSAVILLHCRSGARSSAAEKKLRKLGYAQAHNIGSYQRAKGICDDDGSP